MKKIRKVNGYRIELSQFADAIDEDAEFIYYEELEGFAKKVEYWVHEDYPDACFEDKEELIEYVEDRK